MFHTPFGLLFGTNFYFFHFLFQLYFKISDRQARVDRSTISCLFANTSSEMKEVDQKFYNIKVSAVLLTKSPFTMYRCIFCTVAESPTDQSTIYTSP